MFYLIYIVCLEFQHVTFDICWGTPFNNSIGNLTRVVYCTFHTKTGMT